MARSGSLKAAIVVALLLAGACAVLLWAPWHGPIVLTLSNRHGVDTGDLPALLLIGLAVAAPSAGAAAGWRGAGRWARPASAVVLGALLMVGVVKLSSTSRLVPAGGGTFAGSTEHADGRRAEPVGRWSHLAITYDRKRLRLFVNGSEVSSRVTSGSILKTSDPLWIGGNHPYGEYFQGSIDEVRVYNRMLSAGRVRAEMSTPIRPDRRSSPAGLVAAYAFDEDSRTVAADSSGHDNAGAITGATWTDRGRFGGALRFGGSGESVRVPASASLDVTDAMTLSAWVRPSESQGGWRTIMHRQTDAYFLMAGGGGGDHVGALDDTRFVLLIIAAVCFCVLLAASGRRGRRRSWWQPVALFVAGSLVDAALAPSGTLVGPILVALWLARTAMYRGEAVSMYLLGAVFAAVSLVALVGPGDLGRDDGGIVRSAALGLILVTAGLLSARQAPAAERRDAAIE